MPIKKIKKIGFFLSLFLLLFTTLLSAKTVKYNLKIHEKNVNFTGKNIIALGINNQIPAPTIEATVGDTLEITVENTLDEDSSIHWHGLLLPNDQDGVPYLTTQPIKAHSIFKYKFKARHSGTYWYHSHSGLQEQRGLYGSIVFHPKGGERHVAHQDHVVVLSDWNDENPNQVLANIKKDGDWYALKKDSVQSWDRVLANGAQAIENRLNTSWTRMGPMDLSDVGYDAFLSNGKKENALAAKPGQLVKLRLINAGTSTYFNVEFAGDPMLVIASDGVDIEPLNVKRLRISMAETYDVLVKIPDNRSYELRATAQDGTGYSSTFIGSGHKVFAPDIPRPNLFLINHSMHDMKKMDSSMKEMDHSQHKMMMPKMSQKKNKTIAYLSNYKNIKSLSNTSLPKGVPERVVNLELTGNMERYVWSINNKTLKEEDTIFIRKGENVKFILINKTMMNHPMHLHGHFFRVLNGQGEKSPLKHTVNVAPMETIEIEFEANEEKDWFFHCHNLYHMKNGMARFVSYEDSTQVTDFTRKMLTQDHWYYGADVSALSQMIMGRLRASNSRNAFVAEFDYNYKKEYDVDLMYERNFTRFLDVYVGANIERAGSNKKQEGTAIIGVHYILPFLIESDLRLDSKGKVRFGLGSTLQLTSRVKFDWVWNTNKEHRFGLSYEMTKNALLTIGYDSDFKWGAGLRAVF